MITLFIFAVVLCIFGYALYRVQEDICHINDHLVNQQYDIEYLKKKCSCCEKPCAQCTKCTKTEDDEI